MNTSLGVAELGLRLESDLPYCCCKQLESSMLILNFFRISSRILIYSKSSTANSLQVLKTIYKQLIARF